MKTLETPLSPLGLGNRRVGHPSSVGPVAMQGRTVGSWAVTSPGQELTVPGGLTWGPGPWAGRAEPWVWAGKGASPCLWGHERPRVRSRSDGVREDNVIQ